MLPARALTGELEAILHRRMTQWGLFNGLFQALNDTSVLGDTVWLTVDTPQGAVNQMHSQSLLLNRCDHWRRWRWHRLRCSHSSHGVRAPQVQPVPSPVQVCGVPRCLALLQHASHACSA